MSDIKERLREAVQKLRRTPMAIADVAPMLQDASDHIATLEQESAANLQRALVAEKDAERYRKIRATTKAVRNDEGTERIEVSPEDFDMYVDKMELKGVSIAPDTSTQEVG